MRVKGLLLIDVQEGFNDPFWGIRNNPDAEDRIARLLAQWRDARAPVIHVQHCSDSPSSPLHPDSPGVAFMSISTPQAGEPVFRKSVNSAFIGTGLHEYLQQNKINRLVVAGFTTDHCVSTSVRMAGNLGYGVELVADATATFGRQDGKGRHIPAELIHDIHLLSLDREFCRVVSSDADLLSASQ